MVYETFLNTVKEQVALALGEDHELTLRKVPKNNGTILDGLCISQRRSPIAPTIYLNSCYEQYKGGRPIEDITGEILSLYHANPVPDLPDCSALSDFQAMKERIACRLIHRESNQALLSQVPHIPWLDLELVFYLCLQEDEQGLMTALIHNEHLDIWNISLKTLYDTAMTNTPKLFPPVISSMARILEEMTDIPIESDQEIAAPFYVLTNTCGINGSVCMLYPHVLKNFAEGTECDLVILPSSIHEVLLLPDHEDISYQEMSSLVTHINHSEVSSADRLSNQVYLYKRESETITLAFDASVPVPSLLS